MRTAAMKPFFITLIFLLFSLALASVHAALPPTLNYQGHLTDDGGVPVDGAVNMTFSLFDVDVGGTAQWSDTRSVTVNQGVFSVELGASPNPFPPNLFETLLWMGLTVDGDNEMLPRRPVSSSAYSFKAQDANRLEGSTAAALDQSAHVADTANPHNVTAGQIGAADAGTLASHIGNSANPHAVTAAQTGAASAADFTAHAANSAAHHLRYSNAEAVAAMGVKNDANALNHDKYSNAEAVAAILAADGAGSTLDSDKVDGLEASELIDAAQDEVRAPISSLPYTISQSGSYYLTGNLDGSAGGIDINADDVTLDLMGFTTNGGGSVADYGIEFNSRSNVTIRNGTVKGFGYAGIFQVSGSARYARVMDVQVLGNGTLGTNSNYSGIYIISSNSHVERCTAGGNGGYGIFVYTSSMLINNIAYNNSGAYALFGNTGSTLTGNTAYSNSGSYAIFGNNGSSLTGNTAYGNSGYAIYGAAGSTLTGNTVYSNDHWGIYGSGANLIKDNTIYSNNTTTTAGEGGLHVGADSRVIGNMLDSNSQNNIYVTGSDTALIENHVTDSTNGINFISTGNFYRNNTAAGNTVNYAGFVPAGNGNGGGNASF